MSSRPETYSSYGEKSSFSAAIFFMSPRRKKAMRAVYAFSRIVDDIADSTEKSRTEKKILLENWRTEIKKAFAGQSSTKLPAELAALSPEFGLEEKLFLLLIDGVEMDADGRVYRSFEELKKYMYLVAGVPGLLTLDLSGYKGPLREKIAETTGCALQLTNIIRDVFQDAREGRFYFPLDEAERFGIKPEQLARGEKPERFNEFMTFQAERAKACYEESGKLIKGAFSRKLFIALMMRNIYLELLKEIEKIGFDTVQKIPKISKAAKIRALIKSFFGF